MRALSATAASLPGAAPASRPASRRRAPVPAAPARLPARPLARACRRPRHVAIRASTPSSSSEGTGGGDAAAAERSPASASRRQMLVGAGAALCGCGCGALLAPHSAEAMAALVQADSEALSKFDTKRDARIDRSFARGMDSGPTGESGGMGGIELAVRGRKERLFKEMFAALPAAPTIVEVGAGTLPNARFYLGFSSKGQRAELDLIGVDPNDFMAERFRYNAKENGLGEQRFVHGVAEALPLADGTADAVVCTLTLCSVPDPDRAVAEIKRVLKPGGRFVFLEHVISETDPTFAALQDKLTPLQVAQADGCHLNRHTLATIEAAGFSRVDGEYYELDGFGLLKPQVCGYAIA